MATGNTFPAFIRAQYDPSSGGFEAFQKAGTAALRRVEQDIDATFGKVSKSLAAGGDFKFDLGSLRRATAAAQQQAAAKRLIADAAEQAAAKETQDGDAARLAAQQARAASIEADNYAASLQQQVAVMGRIQAEAGALSGRTIALQQASRGLTQEFGRGTTATGASRYAYIQLGQQLQDITVSLQGGQRATTVFAQQLPQAALAMAGLGGRIGAVATFLSGPWGAAVFGGISVLGLLGSALYSAGTATDDLGSKQKSLADIIDSTTGAIDRQIGTVGRLAAAQQTQRQLTESRSALLAGRAQILAALDAQLPQRSGYSSRAGFIEAPRTRASGATNPLPGLRSARNAFASFGSTDDLVASLNKLAETNPALRKLTGTVVGLGGGVSEAEQQSRKLAAQLRVNAGTATSADRALLGYGQSLAETAENSVDFETATSAVDRAQIRLKDVQREGREAVKAGAESVAQYTARYREAKTALNAAQAAEKGARDARREHNQEVREGTKLAREQAAAQETARRIGERYDDQPSLIDQMAQDERTLAAIRNKFGNSKETVARVDEAEKKRQAAPAVIYDKTIEQSERQLEIQNLIAQGRDTEADALQMQFQLMERIGAKSLDQLQTELRKAGVYEDVRQTLLGIAAAQEASARAMEQQQRAVSLYKDAIGDTQRSVETFLNAVQGRQKGAFKGLVDGLLSNYQGLKTKTFTEQLFGGLDNKIVDMVKGKTGIDGAVDKLVTETGRVTTGMTDVGTALFHGAAFLRRVVSDVDRPGSAANVQRALVLSELPPEPTGSGDPDTIVVTGQRLTAATEANTRAVLSAMEITNDSGALMSQRLKEMGVKLPAALDKILKNNLGGVMDGVNFGSKIGSLFGNKGGEIGKGVGGLFAAVLGKDKMGKISPQLDAISQSISIGETTGELVKVLGLKGSKTGGALGGLAGGAFFGPLGAAIGGALGSTIGGLLKTTKFGSSTISYSGGRASTSTTGNDSGSQKGSSAAADSVTKVIDNIVSQLGGSIASGINGVSLGVRHGDYRVDASGTRQTKIKKGAVDFNEDAEAAVRYAVQLMVERGIIAGLRASTQRLLQTGDDIDAALEKAVKFESVFTRLKTYMDPVGAALDTIDKEFQSLKSIFDEAGASADEYAQLEQLYGLERKKAIEDTTNTLTSALKGLLSDLTTGDNGLSLRDRLTNALQTYNPLANDIRAGKTVDYDAFAEAARTVLDIQRQMSGSQTDYFNMLNDVTDLTKAALAAQENVISIATGRASPFATTSTTTASNDNSDVVSGLGAVQDAIDAGNEQMVSLLSAINSNLVSSLASGSTGTTDYVFGNKLGF